jgi:hypothetical protein
MPNIDPEEAERFLNEQDRKYGINRVAEEVVEKKDDSSQKITSLGKAQSHQQLVEMSAAEESPWKLLDLATLPSGGLFYPEGVELLLRSAKTKEIRHWSTIDENDPIDVREKIQFILNACTKFKIKGQAMPLNFNDFDEVDKYHILFRIYELTFPNQENKLWAYIKCENAQCQHINQTQVTSRNLIGFKYPQELMKWYSPEERCFVINSEKLGETFRIYLPTVGTSSKFKQKRREEQERGIAIDEAFYNFGPYMIRDWRKVDMQMLTDLKLNSMEWGDKKFMAIHKFTDLLEKASLNKTASVCEKCKTQTESHIFLGGSFTVKDIFIISAGLDELI